MADFLHIDGETRSRVDLPKSNAYVYFDDYSTDVWCVGMAFNHEEPFIWSPGNSLPERVRNHIESGGLLKAWNAAFERLLLSHILGPKYGWPVPKLTQWRCTMAAAYAMGFPGRLEKAALAMNIGQGKDMAGNRLMLQMSKPRNPKKDESAESVRWWDDAERLARLVEYCLQDVVTEREVGKRLVGLSDREQRVWFLDQIMNDRGVKLDKALITQSKRVATEALGLLDEDMARITQGSVPACSSVAALSRWIARQGVVTPGLAKADISELLKRELPPKAKEALLLRQEAAKTSVAKVDAMLARCQRDERMRGNLQYHGATTGRWAARGAQLQNLPRPEILKSDDTFDEDYAAAIDCLLSGDASLVRNVYKKPLTLIADCIRGMIIAEAGHDLLSADFSNIEGRIVAFLSSHVEKLNAFRAFDEKRGHDLYLLAADEIFHCGIENAKPLRSIGKVAELALGFEGGPNALVTMATNYRVDVAGMASTAWRFTSDQYRERALDNWESWGKTKGLEQKTWLGLETVKLSWRDANQPIADLWRGLMSAAKHALKDPSKAATYKHIAYHYRGQHLWCRLPSGRLLCYPFAQLEMQESDFGAKEAVTFYSEDSITKKWMKFALYGGLATENVTQAAARDTMLDAAVRVEKAGYPVVLSVHDELIAERKKGEGSLDEFKRLMETPSPWCADMPVAVAGWRADRYRK